MHLALILVVLAALVAAEQAPSQPVENPGLAAAGVLATLALVALIATLAPAAMAVGLQRNVRRRRTYLKCWRWLKAAYWALWLAACGLMLYGLHWPQVIAQNWQLDRWILFDDAVLLTPLLAPLPIGWIGFHQVDRSLFRLAQEFGWDAPKPRLGQELKLQSRLYLGLILLPVLAMLAAHDLADWWLPGWEQTYGPLVFAPLLAAMLIGLPLLLRRIWTTRSLEPGPLRRRLAQTLEKQRVGVRDLLVWHTNGRMVNAAVTGLCGPLRYVLLTDALIAELSDEQLEAVVLHEVGHVRRHHFLLRSLLLFLPMWYWLLLVPPDSSGVQLQPYLQRSMDANPSDLMFQMALIGSVGLYALLALGGYARWLEYDADLWSCMQNPKGREAGAHHFASALLHIARLQHEERGSWLHPSSRARARFALSVGADERVARRFRRRLLCGHLLLVLALVVPLWLR